MILKRLEVSGFKSFAHKAKLEFNCPVTAIVGPNGSGKSNVAEAFRFVLGEQSFKSMRGKRGEDMIFSGTDNVRRANIAEVTLIFDNSDRRFSNIDFDEVRIGRAVHRDGENNYFINGSKARLKDIIELLSAVHIGASSHHIISQGETDRILNAKPLERRSIVEEALGLKIYQYKRKESEKKLLKTEENLKEAKALRRELTPRMNFLKEQVAKIERARAIQKELEDRYREFLRREYVYITETRKALDEEERGPEEKLRQTDEEISRLKEEISRENSAEQKNSEIVELEEAQQKLDDKKGEVYRDIGRLEGEIKFRKSRLQNLGRSNHSEPSVPWSSVSYFIEDMYIHIDRAGREREIEEVHGILEDMRGKIRGFLNSFIDGSFDNKEEYQNLENELSELEGEVENRRAEMEIIKRESEELSRKRNDLRKEMDNDQSASREAERRMFECMSAQQELRGQLERIRGRRSQLERVDADFKRELQDAANIVGSFILDYKEYEIKDEEGRVLSSEEILRESREEQEKRRKEIERSKIRLEELSVGSHKEIMDEYEEVKERDEFLAKEVEDLESSMDLLRSVIADLEETIRVRFEEGLERINSVFHQFFVEMFGGGSASLRRIKVKTKGDNSAEAEEEEEGSEYVEGLEISVSIPRKNIKGLLMLSGGERALTSIALIFAMSQVNPPPFLILDETDAALDESNSQKYGALIEKLAEHSQLILITHNRETMARAEVLYGITMDSGGTSKILSVRIGEEGAVEKNERGE
ncbi:MAG: chromosome segregation SMC family protein [Patescibacteria group bacterium]